MKKFGNLLWGIVLIGIGLILALNATGVTSINIFFDGWWTLFIIVPCFISLFREKEKIGNIIGLLIGIILLLCCQGLLEFDTICKLMLPTILIIIGVCLIFKDVFNKKVTENIKKLNENRTDKNEYCATFSGQNIDFGEEKFTGTDLTAVFGGIKCDLKNAVIDQDVVINTSSIFGGIDIFVPEDINVKVKSSSIFGGVTDQRKTKNQKDITNTIYINATCLFGGVEIK